MAIPSEEETLAKLNEEEQFTIRIKPEKDNPNYVTERVYVNGVCIQIEVGKDVKISKTVRDLLVAKGVI